MRGQVTHSSTLYEAHPPSHELLPLFRCFIHFVSPFEIPRFLAADMMYQAVNHEFLTQLLQFVWIF